MSRRNAFRYARVFFLMAALGATICFAFWAAGMLPAPRFTRTVRVSFEWNSTTGFSKFQPNESYLWWPTVAGKAKPQVDAFLRRSHLQTASGKMGAVEVEVVKLLPIVRSTHVDGDLMEDPDRTSLMKAAYYGDLAETLRLLPRSDLNAKDQAGLTALIWSCVGRPQPEIVKALLAAGAAVNARDDSGRNALWAAAETDFRTENDRKDKEESIHLLLAAGADPNVAGRYGYTALMTAAYINDPATAKTLLDAGADPNLKNSAGDTALSIARSKGNAEVVKVLLRHRSAR